MSIYELTHHISLTFLLIITYRLNLYFSSFFIFNQLAFCSNAGGYRIYRKIGFLFVLVTHFNHLETIWNLSVFYFIEFFPTAVP